MAQNILLTEFDLITVTPLMQIVKAVIPYLDLQSQRLFSFMVRFYEFQQTMNFFNTVNNCDPFSDCKKNCHHPPIRSINDILSNDEILDSIIKHCPENYAAMINGYRQFSKMSQMFDMFNFAGADTQHADNGTLDISSVMNLMKQFDTSNTATKETNTSKNNFFNNSPSFMQGIMNSSQQSKYEEYLKELDNINFDDINIERS